MTKQLINLGTSPNKGDGDPLRIAFDKVNDNFNELYSSIEEITEISQDSFASMVTNGVQTNIVIEYNDEENLINFEVPNQLSLYENDVDFISKTYLLDSILNGTQTNITVEFDDLANSLNFAVNSKLSSYENDVNYLSLDTTDSIILNSDVTFSRPVSIFDDLILENPAPTTSKGAAADKKGSVAFDSNYLYYCVQDYTDGVADIWKRVQLATETW